MAIELLVPQSQVFGNTAASRGDGSMIAMKIALQAFRDARPFLVFSPGSLSENAKYLSFSCLVSRNPLAAARGIAASGKRVLVFAGDVATENCIESFRNVQESIAYVCLNNGGSASAGSRFRLEKQLLRTLVSSGTAPKYAATASVSFPEDYMGKLLKAAAEPGPCFIEVHCPSPSLWGFDPSNTIEVGRAAVNSNIWPLLEYSDGRLAAMHRPEMFDPPAAYARMQSRFSERDAEALQNAAAGNMKLFA